MVIAEALKLSGHHISFEEKETPELESLEDTLPNFAEAHRLFLLEAALSNALAMHDLGRLFADGLGCGTIAKDLKLFTIRE